MEERKTEQIRVPSFDGFECIGVMIPPKAHMDDVYIMDSSGNNIYPVIEFCYEDIRWAQLCYRKIKPKRITFESTGEVRPPKVGEWFKSSNGDYLCCDTHYNGPREIYRIVEEQS